MDFSYFDPFMETLAREALAAIQLKRLQLQLGQILEGEAQSFASGDKGQSTDRAIVVEPIAGRGARDGSYQPEIVVITQSGRRKPSQSSNLGNRVCRHDIRVNLQPHLKVKRPKEESPLASTVRGDQPRPGAEVT